MKVFTLLPLLAVLAVVQAASHERPQHHGRRHITSSRLSRRADNPQGRCRARDGGSSATASATISSSASSSAAPETSSVASSTSSSSADASASTGSSGNADWQSKTNGAWTAGGGAISGLLNVASNCGDIGATSDITDVSGPNGNIYWLTCGVNDQGWNPPYIKISDLITKDLGQAVQDPNSPFQACTQFIDLFYKYGYQYNIPPIMLASFAMQESTCNPETVGGAGEQGLMQLTADKCNEAPGGNCKDWDYNVRMGAQYFSDTLNSNGGDVLVSIGQYNGWSKGMTYGSATAALATGCCRCQQNLDYLHQFLNGWLQNVDAYTNSPPLGVFWNLNQCGN